MLGGLNEVISIARTWINAVQSDGSVHLPGAGAPTGAKGWLHPEWALSSPTRLVGRTADRKHAYKQVAPRPSHRFAAVVAVLDSTAGEVKLFDSLVLAFGETAAVYAFNRLTQALRWIAVTQLNLVLTSYFDDFPQLEAEVSGDSARSSFMSLLEILGWGVAVDESKNKRIGQFFDLLGSGRPCRPPPRPHGRWPQRGQDRVHRQDHLGRHRTRNALPGGGVQSARAAPVPRVCPLRPLRCRRLELYIPEGVQARRLFSPRRGSGRGVALALSIL